MNEQVCTQALGYAAKLGFKAYELDDHTLIVEYKDKRIGQFYISNNQPTIETLRKFCNQYYNQLMFKRVNSDMRQAYEDLDKEAIAK